MGAGGAPVGAGGELHIALGMPGEHPWVLGGTPSWSFGLGARWVPWGGTHGCWEGG